MICKDSFSFLSSSLYKLAHSHKYEENNKKDNWHERFTNSKLNEYARTMMISTYKGIYDHMDDFTNSTKPNYQVKSIFYSNLTEQEITDEDYNKAKQIWKNFNIKNLGEITTCI